MVSNNRGLNEAAENNAPLKGPEFAKKYGYSYYGEKCYSTFVGGKFNKGAINDTTMKDGKLKYSKSDRLLNSASGFINAYNGNGFTKEV